MTKKRVRKYPKALRQMALERMRSCENVSALAQELRVNPTVLYHCRFKKAGRLSFIKPEEV